MRSKGLCLVIILSALTAPCAYAGTSGGAGSPTPEVNLPLNAEQLLQICLAVNAPDWRPCGPNAGGWKMEDLANKSDEPAIKTVSSRGVNRAPAVVPKQVARKEATQ